MKHGMSGTYIHAVWRMMLYRCDNPNCPDYHNYGGRGVTYDPRWKDFENFLADMGPRPPKRTLDRIDNNGPYCKANCRWSTKLEQSRNQRKTIMLTHEGRTQSLAAWAEEKNMTWAKLYQRWRRYGNNEALLFA